MAIQAHRVVLAAASPHIYNLLVGVNTDGWPVCLMPVQSSTIENLLSYIYSGKLDLSCSELTKELKSIGLEWQIEDLLYKCKSELSAVSIANVVSDCTLRPMEASELKEFGYTEEADENTCVAVESCDARQEDNTEDNDINDSKESDISIEDSIRDEIHKVLTDDGRSTSAVANKKPNLNVKQEEIHDSYVVERKPTLEDDQSDTERPVKDVSPEISPVRKSVRLAMSRPGQCKSAAGKKKSVLKLQKPGKNAAKLGNPSKKGHQLTTQVRKSVRNCKLPCKVTGPAKRCIPPGVVRVSITKPYTCRLCSASFKTMEEGTSHVGTEHGIAEKDQGKYMKYPAQMPKKVLPTYYKCDSCDYMVSTVWSVLYHRFCEHNIPIPKDRLKATRPCEICNKLCRGKKTYDLHMSKHTKEKAVRCEICQSSFRSYVQLRLHTNSEHSTNPQKKNTYQCPKCKYSTMILAHLKRHIEQHSDRKPHLCQFCGYATVDKSSLRAHEKRMHRTDRSGKGLDPLSKDFDPLPRDPLVRDVKCTHCDAYFCRKGFLQKHMSAKHGISFSPKQVCEICGGKFASAASLRNHIKIKHDDKKPPKNFKCSHCEYTTFCSSHLVRHERRHTGEKPFKCSHCSYACIESHDLVKHIEKKHKKAQEIFYCKFCGRSFNRKYSLAKHTSARHGDGNQGRIECPTCEKTFASKKSLTAHMKLHVGIGKPREKLCCPECPFSTFSTDSLSKHMQKHSEIKPFQCPHCSFACGDESYMKTHIQNMHLGVSEQADVAMEEVSEPMYVLVTTY